MGTIVKKCSLAIVVCSLLLAAVSAQAGAMVGSKHDLSAKGDQICPHCHMPTGFHNTGNSTPVWAKDTLKDDTGKATYVSYNSEAVKGACTAKPGGVSMVCLSCHDGSSGRAVYSEPKPLGPGNANVGYTANDEACQECHKGTNGEFSSKVQATLTKTTTAVGGHQGMNHPIARPYPDGEKFFSPPDSDKGWPDVRLYNKKVECPSCHAVHDPTVKPFLRVDNGGSALCLRCHNK